MTAVVLADTVDTWVGLAVSAALLVYLVVALVLPEKF